MKSIWTAADSFWFAYFVIMAGCAVFSPAVAFLMAAIAFVTTF